MTKEELALKIKSQHPQYAKMENNELADLNMNNIVLWRFWTEMVWLIE